MVKVFDLRYSLRPLFTLPFSAPVGVSWHPSLPMSLLVAGLDGSFAVADVSNPANAHSYQVAARAPARAPAPPAARAWGRPPQTLAPLQPAARAASPCPCPLPTAPAAAPAPFPPATRWIPAATPCCAPPTRLPARSWRSAGAAATCTCGRRPTSRGPATTLPRAPRTARASRTRRRRRRRCRRRPRRPQRAARAARAAKRRPRPRPRRRERRRTRSRRTRSTTAPRGGCCRILGSTRRWTSGSRQGWWTRASRRT
jgi:hypothetical protein